MNAIQIDDAIVGVQRALSPRFILLSQGLIEATHGARAGGNSHQFFRHFSHVMGTRAADKHLGQGFSHFRFIALVALKDLSMKLPFSVSWDLDILNASSRSHEIARVGPIAIASALGRTFSPRG